MSADLWTIGLISDQLDVGSSNNDFPQFRELPTELRLMVWEYTWPNSRVIEARRVYLEDDSEDGSEHSENNTDWQTEYLGDDSEHVNKYLVLRLAGGLSTLLLDHEELYTRSTDEVPYKTCLDPVALWVCQESRTHTMNQYITIRYPVLETSSFYFSPRRDVLQLSLDATDEIYLVLDLRLYGHQLKNVAVALVEKLWQDEKTPKRYYSSFLNILSGLRTVLLLFDDPPEAAEFNYEQEVNELRVAHQRLLNVRTWTMQYMDLMGTIY